MIPNRAISHLKNRILVQGRGGDEFQSAGILEYFEDWERVTNKDIGPKDIFEMAYKYLANQPTVIYQIKA